MGYFPFFIDLAGREGLIAGGGEVAARKVRSLLPYGPRLTVAAPEVSSEIVSAPEVTVLRRPFGEELLAGKVFVIAATDDPAENHRIAALCRERDILVNVADDRDWCGFLFPALVRRGGLTVGISTGGSSPAAAAWVRQQAEDLLPENFGELLSFLESRREEIHRTVSRAEDRSSFFRTLLRQCLALEADRWPGAYEALLGEFTGNINPA